MVCPPSKSSNNHDMQKPELVVGDTDCKWMSGRTAGPYVRQRAVYAAIAKVAGGLFACDIDTVAAADAFHKVVPQWAG